MQLSVLESRGVRIITEHRVQSKLIAAGHRTRSLVCKNGVERLGGLVENPFLVALRERG